MKPLRNQGFACFYAGNMMAAFAFIASITTPIAGSVR